MPGQLDNGARGGGSGSSRVVTFLEVAVYVTGEVEGFPAIRVAAAQQLCREPGFLWWERLSADDGVRADLVAWRTGADGRAAARKVSAAPEYRPFLTSIHEVRHFAHYWAPMDAGVLAERLRCSPLVEVATYTVRNPAPSTGRRAPRPRAGPTARTRRSTASPSCSVGAR